MARGRRDPKGLDRLCRQIDALPSCIVERVSEQNEINAEDLAERIRAAAPRKTGDLQDSIGWAKGPSGKTGGGKWVSRSQVLGAFGLVVRVFAGRSSNDGGLLGKPRWVEFGTAAAPAGRGRDKSGKMRKRSRPHAATRPNPFFYPTIRAFKRIMKTRLRRAGRRAAKDAAAVR